MHKPIRWFVFALLCIFYSIQKPCFAQQHGGFKWIHAPQSACLTEEEHQIEVQRARRMKDSLLAARPVSYKSFTQNSSQKLFWPLRWLPGFEGKSYYGISNYFDLTTGAGVKDFQCQSRTYDGHTGTDIFLWPAYWLKMKEEQVDVVAAQKGIILSKLDGNFDQQCVWSNTPWNAVYVLHPGNIIAWYGHMKKNTLTSKNVGDSVAIGEYLGKVGSSGRSNGPHLHFEVLVNNVSKDPYQGPCNMQATLWDAQKPYFNPFLNLSHTVKKLPVFPPCPQPEIMNKQEQFEVGDTVFLLNYYRDLRRMDTTILLLFNAQNQRIDSIHTIHDFQETFWDAGAWYWFYTFPDTFPQGNYYFQSIYKKDTTRTDFKYGLPTQTIEIKAKPFLFYNDLEKLVHWEHGCVHSSDAVFYNPFGQVKKRIQLQPGQTKMSTYGFASGIYYLKIDGFVKRLWIGP